MFAEALQVRISTGNFGLFEIMMMMIVVVV